MSPPTCERGPWPGPAAVAKGKGNAREGSTAGRHLQARLDHALDAYAEAAARWYADPSRETERARLEALVAVAEVRAYRPGWRL